MFRKLTRQQWLVLLGACLFQCGMVGVLVNCSGVLFSQIRAELGLSMSKISAYNTIKGIGGALLAAAVTDIFFKSNKQKFLIINQSLLLGSYMLLIFDTNDIVWYISAFLCGLSSCITTVAVPSVLNQRIPEYAGSATGIATAFSGLGGAVCNPLCAKLITMFGWRVTILILGALMMLLTVPGAYLMFHLEPEEKHTTVLGKKRTETGKLSASTLGSFILLSVVLLTGSVGVQFATDVSIYAQSIGYTLAASASLATMVMIGNVSGKFLYGYLCDALGVWKASMIIILAIGAAAGSFLLAQASLPLLHIAALLFGVSYAVPMVGLSRCGVAAYGPEEYHKFIGFHSCIHSIATAACSMLFGVMFDNTQCIDPILYVVATVAMISLGATMALSRKNMKHRISVV